MLQPFLLLLALNAFFSDLAYANSCGLLFGNQTLDPNIREHGVQIANESRELLRDFDKVARKAIAGLVELDRVLFIADAAAALSARNDVIDTDFPSAVEKLWMEDIPSQSLSILNSEFPQANDIVDDSFSELIHEVDSFLNETGKESTDLAKVFSDYLRAVTRAINFNINRIRLVVNSQEMPKDQKIAFLDISLTALQNYESKLNLADSSLRRSVESMAHKQHEHRNNTPAIENMIAWVHRDERGEVVPNDEYRDLKHTWAREWNKSLKDNLNNIRTSSTTARDALAELDRKPDNTSPESE